jgi:hypothetical protein
MGTLDKPAGGTWVTGGGSGSRTVVEIGSVCTLALGSCSVASESVSRLPSIRSLLEMSGTTAGVLAAGVAA